MLRLLLIIALLSAVIWFLGYYKRLPASQRNAALMRALVYFIAAVLLLLVATGRISWIFALIGAALPWINRLQMLHQAWGLFKGSSKHKDNDKQHQSYHQSQQQSKQNGDMSLAQAYRILNIDESADKSQVIAAHRKQMQLNHPDRGGSDYIAQQINLARDIILKHLGQ